MNTAEQIWPDSLAGGDSARLSSSSTWPPFLVGQTSQPARVILIDDDAHLRLVVARELLADRRIDLVGQAASLREGKRLIALHEFDVMLVDLNLGDGTGFELIQYMKIIRPHAEAVVLSTMDDDEHAIHAFELGATGYLVKNSWFDNFPLAVLQVVNGGASITPGLARRLMKRLDGGSRPETGGAPVSRAPFAGERLSEREREILKLVATGHTSAEIGRCLDISERTVTTHIKNMYRKLQVRTRAQAVNLASRCGLL